MSMNTQDGETRAEQRARLERLGYRVADDAGEWLGLTDEERKQVKQVASEPLPESKPVPPPSLGGTMPA